MSDIVSLIDTAYSQPVDRWAVFLNLNEDRFEGERSKLWRFLKPGFQHVEVWKYVPPGAWIRFDTTIEFINVEVFADPPWVIQKHLNPTCVRVRRNVPNGKWRERFFLGPITCVELSKAFLGISNFFVRTPYKLYKYLLRENKK